MTDTTSTTTPDATVTASVSVDPAADTVTATTTTTVHLSLLSDIAEKLRAAGADVEEFVSNILAKAKTELEKL